MRWLSLILALVLPALAFAQSTEVVRRADEGVFRIVTDRSAGTGYLVTSNGYLLTNHHVVRGADRILVLMPDDTGNRLVDAHIVRADRNLDMAVLRAPGLQGRPLALNVSEPEKGLKVFALGFPGLADLRKPRSPQEFVDMLKHDPNYTNSSHTNGDVSRVVRERWVDGSERLNIVQHTAAVRHGNSGGPLLNLCGEVIGMNTEIRSDPTAVTVHLASAASEVAEFAHAVGISLSTVSTPCRNAPGGTAGLLYYAMIAVASMGLLTLGAVALIRRKTAVGISTRARDDLSKRLRELEARAQTGARDAAATSGPADPVWRIKFTAPSGKRGLRFRTSDASRPLVIGRDEGVHFVLPEAGVSRRHAAFRTEGNVLMIEDIGSTNGTFVNGRRLAPSVPERVSDGDRIQLASIAGELRKE